MSQLLREVARRFRYVEIPEIVGSLITLESEESVKRDIHDSLTQILPAKFLPLAGLPNFNLGALSKYRILDIEYTIEDTKLAGGRNGLRVLEQLGLVVPADWDGHRTGNSSGGALAG